MQEKLAIVTGASSGIGEAIAKNLSSLNYKVILLGRNLERLKKVGSDLLGSEFYQCDLQDLDQIFKVSHNLVKKFEADSFSKAVLINNAGIVTRNSFEKNSIEEWQSQFQTNLFGPALLTQHLLPFLKKQKDARIVNISSNLAMKPIKETSVYSASKAALNSMTQCLALELAPFKIPVNAVCPGIVETPIHSFFKTEDEKLRTTLNQAQPLGRMGQPDDIAKIVSFLAEHSSDWMTGALIPVDGGILLNG